MVPLYAMLAFLVAQRLFELAHARSNHQFLLDQGGVEFGRRHYRLIVLLHVGWLLSLALLIPPDRPAALPFLVLFGLLQVLRVWSILSLGRFWATRIIVLPGAERVRVGPYRFAKHPLYAVVFLELATVPLMFGEWRIAAAASVLNGLLLRTRVQVEEKALAEAYGA